jgi:zinc transport system substrate-binding protein
MFRRFSFTLLLMAAVLLSNTSHAESGPKPTVYVVNYPLQYFAEQLAGDAINVVFPVPPNEDPAFWTPSAEEVHAIQTADLVILNGAGYAKWIGNISLRKSRLVDTSAAFKDQLISVESVATHQHGPKGDHAHAGVAFTTWLDFDQARQQSRAVAEALQKLLPDQSAEIEKNAQRIKRDLSDLDTRLMKVGEAMQAKPLMASHPVYQYMARRYHLNLRSILWEPGIAPDAMAWREFEKVTAAHPAKWMLWEQAPAPESAAQVRKRGLESLVFYPCSNTPVEGDFLSVMKTNIAALERAAR